MNPWVIAGLIVVSIVALYALHRAALWLEREGWIRYIHNPPKSGHGAGAAVGELQRIFEPQTQHVYELKEQKRTRREAEDGAELPDKSA